MNILGNNTNKLNDVIFENRNKNYGAYVIRTSYNDTLKKSLLFLTSALTLLFGSVVVNNRMNSHSEAEKPIAFEDPKLTPMEYTTKVDLTPITEPEQKTTEAAAAPKGTIGTVINNHAVETNSVNLENPVSGVGDETSTGTDPKSTDPGTVTTIHVENNTPPATTPVDILVFAEEMPEFEGGTQGLMRFIGQNVVYPSVAREIGKEGIVYVSFVVNEVGNVENVKVVKGIGYGCDEEVVRVINKMPRWKKAGRNAGHPVKVRFNMPVSFKLK